MFERFSASLRASKGLLSGLGFRAIAELSVGGGKNSSANSESSAGTPWQIIVVDQKPLHT